MSGRSVQQGAVYTTRDKVGSCRPSLNMEQASLGRQSGGGARPATNLAQASLQLRNCALPTSWRRMCFTLQKMTQTEECGSAQVWAGPFHRLHEAYRLSGTVLSRVSF
ncbi:uncharacterized protein LOC123509063 isoform X2 [Portunus trituberculatus]|uniref:uncharacterized protein LOC123509063 isoform X2 n=1 Tax=Portunus trituberculatus TaxID=210409 RepID=UPI001E1CCE6F|nr:uncharacterized protein LOC123509063 isoform X2 [Portunus trituberculatus]